MELDVFIEFLATKLMEHCVEYVEKKSENTILVTLLGGIVYEVNIHRHKTDTILGG